MKVIDLRKEIFEKMTESFNCREGARVVTTNQKNETSKSQWRAFVRCEGGTERETKTANGRKAEPWPLGQSKGCPAIKEGPIWGEPQN